MSGGPPVAAVAVAAMIGIVGIFAIGASAWSNRPIDMTSRWIAAVEGWKGAWGAEHEAMLAWQRASASQTKLIAAQQELLEERAKYIAVLQQALTLWANSAPIGMPRSECSVDPLPGSFQRADGSWCKP